MPIRNSTRHEIALLAGLKQMASAYEEISVIRMGRVRQGVIASRTFRQGLVRIFSEVRSSQRREFERMVNKTKRVKRRAGLKHSSRPGSTSGQAAVLVSTDQHWSGDIAQQVASSFLAFAAQRPAQTKFVVLGQVGRAYISKLQPQLDFKYYDLPGEKGSRSDYGQLIQYLSGFENITVFYSKFVNVVDQQPAIFRVSGSPALAGDLAEAIEEKDVKTKTQEVDYLYEPDLNSVLRFFDTQILGILFRQTINESRLSLFGSRLTAMENATRKIDSRLSRLKTSQAQAAHDTKNRKQRERLAGISLWGQ